MQSAPSARVWRETVIPEQCEQAWLKDVRSRFLAVSEAFAAACGATPAEMVGKTEAAFFPSRKVELFRWGDRRAIAWGRLIVVSEGSRQQLFRTFKAPVRDDDGRVAGTVGLAIPDDRFPQPETCTWLDLFARPSATRGTDAPVWLRQVRCELDATFSAPVSVAALAGRADRTATYVTRVFREWYGVTPVSYAHRRRVEWTAHALATSELSLSRIAQEAGFTDQSHMTRLFARFFGITPAAYRIAMKMTPGIPTSSG